jgi:ribose 5-phosphate isomerase B
VCGTSQTLLRLTRKAYCCQALLAHALDRLGYMRLGIGSDEDLPVVWDVASWLERQGHEVPVKVVGADWVTVGKEVGQAVADGRVDMGVVMCYTGTGVAIAANKVPGVRAALCKDAETAKGARRWNDANVLALAYEGLEESLAVEIVEAFLKEAPEEGELAIIAKLE